MLDSSVCWGNGTHKAFHKPDSNLKFFCTIVHKSLILPREWVIVTISLVLNQTCSVHKHFEFYTVPHAPGHSPSVLYTFTSYNDTLRAVDTAQLQIFFYAWLNLFFTQIPILQQRRGSKYVAIGHCIDFNNIPLGNVAS